MMKFNGQTFVSRYPVGKMKMIEIARESFDAYLDSLNPVINLGGEDFLYSHVYAAMYRDAYEEDLYEFIEEIKRQRNDRDGE